MEFREFLYAKDKEIEECKELISYIQNSYENFGEIGSNSYILIQLISNKINILKNLQYFNYNTTLSNLEIIDNEIYMQIEILKKETKINSKDENLENLQEDNKKDLVKEFNMEDFIKKHMDKKFNNFITSTLKQFLAIFKNIPLVILICFIVGLIPFAIYFFIELKDVPNMNGFDIFYFMIMSGVAGLIYLVLFLLFPFLYFGIVEVFSSDYKNYKNIRWYLILSNIVAVLGVFVIFMINKENYFSFIVLGIILIFLVIFIFYQNKNKISARKNIELMVYILISTFFTSIMLFIAVFVDYYMLILAVDDNPISSICIVFYIVLIIFIYIGIYKKDIFIFKLSVYIFIFFNLLFLLPMLGRDLMSRLNFGNISFSHIILSKQVKEYIPSNLIYKQDNIKVISYEDNSLTFNCNSYKNKSKNISQNCITFKDSNSKMINTNNKEFKFKDGALTFKNNTRKEQIEANATILKNCLTYIKENNETIELHNITALSILGKFWYLETICGDKFKISSEFIKSGVKK